MKNFLNYFKEHTPAFVQECPFKGRLEFINLTVDQKYFKFFPTGEYKTVIHVYDKIDNNIFTINYNTQLDSN